MTELKDDLLLGANAAADYLGMTPRQIYHFANTGALPCQRLGRRLVFRKSQLSGVFESPKG